MGATHIQYMQLHVQIPPAPSSLLRTPLWDDLARSSTTVNSGEFGGQDLIWAIAGQDTRSSPEGLRLCHRVCGWEVQVSTEIFGCMLLVCRSGATHGSDSLALIPSPVPQSASHTLRLRIETPSRPQRCSQGQTCCRSPMRKRSPALAVRTDTTPSTPAFSSWHGPYESPPSCVVSVRAELHQACISSFLFLSKNSAGAGMAEYWAWLNTGHSWELCTGRRVPWWGGGGGGQRRKGVSQDCTLACEATSYFFYWYERGVLACPRRGRWPREGVGCGGGQSG